MGLFKIILYAINITGIIFLALNHLPNLLDIEPRAYTVKLLKYEGALAVNKELDKAQIILEDQVIAPESLASRNGELYASLVSGKIVKIKNDKIVKTVADTSGMPLGLRFYKDDLYVADMKKGILKVNVETGKVTVIVKPTGTVCGKKFLPANDLDINDGVIYFSVVSTKWPSENVFFAFFEHENSGRVCKHDIATGKTEVLVDGVYIPNGIQVTNDKSSLLISELLKNRILKYHFTGPKKGQTEVFVELPGEPDNIRPSSSGGYWVGMVSCRDESSPELFDRLASYPKIRKALARLCHLLGTGLTMVNEYVSSPLIQDIAQQLSSGIIVVNMKSVHHPIVVEVNDNGKISRSLHSSNPKFAHLSQGTEHDGHLYLGSFRNPYIVKWKL